MPYSKQMSYEERKIYVLNEKDIESFHETGWGADDFEIEEKYIKALQEGKSIGWFDGEYTHVFKLKK